MCEPCGKDIKDIFIRSVSYGAVRWALSSSPAEMVEKPIEHLAGISEEPKPLVLGAKKNHSNIVVKAFLNGAVDILYEKYIYDAEKMKGYKEMLGMCPCEYMKGMWELVAQIAYEASVHKKMKAMAAIKDGVAIYAQFPISKLVSKQVKNPY